MIPFCFTRFFFLGAMARWPFLAPRAAEEGLRDEEAAEAEEEGFRCFLGMPCAILFCFVAGGGAVGIGDWGLGMRVVRVSEEWM